MNGGMTIPGPLVNAPPPFFEKAETARWLTSNNIMGSLNTNSLHLNGTAFSNPYSFADGPCASVNVRPGQLFFYGSELDASFQDLATDSRASFTTSLEMNTGDSKGTIGNYCKTHKAKGDDAEDPRCTRLTLTGTMRRASAAEVPEATKALFAKHSEMATWPTGHEFFVSTLDIVDIWLIDMFGGATVLTSDAYYKARCPTLDVVANDAKPVAKVDLPPWSYNDTIHTARWLAHNMDYGILSTTSSRTQLLGYPFGNPNSFADGAMGVGSSTGRIWFYVSDLDQSMKDIAVNPRCSLAITEAWLDGVNGYQTCLQQNIDPENPTCTRLVFSGEMVTIETTEPDYQLAHDSLFSRHRKFSTWPADHSWKIVELMITDIWMINFYGGAKHLDAAEYYKYQLTTP